MNGINLPRGRFTDGLVAFIVFATVMLLIPAIAEQVIPFGFVPGQVLTGGVDVAHLIPAPLVSQFLVPNIATVLFNTVLLLIAGRYVEHSIGPFGLAATFVAGAYAGALARLVLTSGSFVMTQGANAGLFALVGAYFMLYGVPRALPVPRHYGRVAQIAALALVWVLVQAVFMMVGQQFEVSVSFVDPLGGLVAGMVLAKPLLAWRYRKA